MIISVLIVCATIAFFACATLAQPSYIHFNNRTYAVVDECDKVIGSPVDRRPDRQRLSISTFNVEWLFIEKWDKFWESKAQAELHLRDIADIVRQLNADVLTLTEVEGCTVMKMLRDEVGDPTYRYYLLKGTDTATGQNVGLLTRVDPQVSLNRTSDRVAFPVSGNRCNYNGADGTQGVSKHFFTRIAPTNFPAFMLLGAHLLAFPDRSDRCAKREAQAGVLAQIMLEHLKKYPNDDFVANGDFNDWDAQVPDVLSSRPISRVLDLIKDFDPTNLYYRHHNRTTQQQPFELVNVAEAAQQTQRFTAYYDPMKDSCKPPNQASTSIDHICVGQQLAKRLTRVEFKHLYPPECDDPVRLKFFSDHWPIVAHFS